MRPELSTLLTESDVEQKLVWPLLTAAHPEGCGYTSSDIHTKINIKRIEIGKGTGRRLYYPDYVVVLGGLPVMVVEVKIVGESIDNALDEARMYANEINASYPHGVNPCQRVVACNGNTLATSPVDTAMPDVTVDFVRIHSADTTFAAFLSKCSRASLQASTDQVRRNSRHKEYIRPVTLIGGASFQGEELPQNTFGATIAGDYGHIFNPKSREDRALIAREAYIASTRQQRYVEPIDRLIRNAVAPSAVKITPLESTGNPREIISTLKDRKKLERQIMLLVGSVGAGKSTFVDYLSHVALPTELKSQTVWLRIDLNNAPLDPAMAYQWLTERIVVEFRNSFPDIDFDDLAVLEKVFGQELAAFKKGPLALIPHSSMEFKVRLSDKLNALQADTIILAKATAQYLCYGAGRLLVIVLDNCDKRTRDEQLLMFQTAHWIQEQFRSLVVLPLRDVTFDLYKNHPPLDTALKQFVFRIEPPPFWEVLQARVRLALDEISKTGSDADHLSFRLPNGMKVTYPAEDQALYLASVLRSLYAHDRFVRQVMTGLAGRDVRKALELFLDFCMSGHIGEDEIFKIRMSKGHHVLSISIVARVLLRMQRRFYDGNRAHLKNIVQCDPADSLPDHFVRLTLLNWLSHHLTMRGPMGVEGFHRVADMISDLALLGHSSERVREEVHYLAREGCLVAEHLGAENLSDSDLIKITASGTVHLYLMVNPEYLAACAEDTWVSDSELAKRVASRLSQGPQVHYSPITTARNATEFARYLMESAAETFAAPQTYLTDIALAPLRTLRDLEKNIIPAAVALSDRLFVGGLTSTVDEDTLRSFLDSKGIVTTSIAIMREKSTGVSRGFAFVNVASTEDTLAILDLHGVALAGRALNINEAHPSENGSTQTERRRIGELTERVYIGNLPFSATEQDVRTEVARLNLTPMDVYMLKDGKTGASRGVAFLEFSSLDEAAAAIGGLNGIQMAGRRLQVRPADPRN